MSRLNKLGYMICEAAHTATDSKIVSTGIGGKVIAEGTLQEAEEKNRNGRRYYAKDLKAEIADPRQKELMKAGQFKGELGHPMSKDLGRQQNIEPKLVCVKFLDVWMEGNLVKSRFTGTNNQYGDEFNRDLLDDEKPSFSLRALGAIDQKGGEIYVTNLKIVTYDRVIYPSHKRAYTEKLITESANLGLTGNKFVVEENHKGLITPITDSRIASYVRTESANLKMITESFDTLYESVNIGKDGKTVSIVTKDKDILVVQLEGYIQNEIMNFCSKF